MPTDFNTFHSELNMLHLRLRRAGMRGASPAEVKEWEGTAVSLIEGYSGEWQTYPLMANGVSQSCTPEEASFLRKHNLAMIRLYAISALLKGDALVVTRSELASRLRDLESTLSWLNGHLPPRLVSMGMGTYSQNLDYVDRQLKALGTS